MQVLRSVLLRIGQLASGGMAIWGVGLVLGPQGHWWGWLVILLGVVGVAVGAILSPWSGTGLHVARDAMRMFDDGRAVRDPGGTVDPTDGGGRFSGR